MNPWFRSKEVPIRISTWDKSTNIQYLMKANDDPGFSWSRWRIFLETSLLGKEDKFTWHSERAEISGGARGEQFPVSLEFVFLGDVVSYGHFRPRSTGATPTNAGVFWFASSFNSWSHFDGGASSGLQTRTTRHHRASSAPKQKR